MNVEVGYRSDLSVIASGGNHFDKIFYWLSKLKGSNFSNLMLVSQLAFTYSKLTMGTLKESVKYVQMC